MKVKSKTPSSSSSLSSIAKQHYDIIRLMNYFTNYYIDKINNEFPEEALLLDKLSKTKYNEAYHNVARDLYLDLAYHKRHNKLIINKPELHKNIKICINMIIKLLKLADNKKCIKKVQNIIRLQINNNQVYIIINETNDLCSQYKINANEINKNGNNSKFIFKIITGRLIKSFEMNFFK